jgi:hypothetical protein
MDVSEYSTIAVFTAYSGSFGLVASYGSRRS